MSSDPYRPVAGPFVDIPNRDLPYKLSVLRRLGLEQESTGLVTAWLLIGVPTLESSRGVCGPTIPETRTDAP